MKRVIIGFCVLVTGLLPCRLPAAQIGILGNSYMAPVTDVLDRLQLDHASLSVRNLLNLDPTSLQVLFVAYDVADVDGLASWLQRYRASGGVLFTFYTPAPSLARILGIDQGEYVRDETGKRFAAMHTADAVAAAPDLMRQRSNNIYRVRPLADSVRVVAHWLDIDGQDTGEPALLLGPAGVHMTHVLLGQDAEAATRLYAALLGHFVPDLWDAAIVGALEQASSVGGGPESLTALATGKEARAALEDYTQAMTQARAAAKAGESGAALAQAGRARQAATRALALSQRSREGEFRAVWIHNSFGVGDWGWDRSMKALAAAGFNAIIPNMLDAGQASYPSDYLPTHPRVAAEGDQMAALVAAAKKYGIQVHAWKVNYNLSTAPADFVETLRQQGRLQADAEGVEMPWLCPSHPENRRLEVESMLEVVRNYDVDGIHFDYIRYPGVQSCYDDGCRLRFQQQTGHDVGDWPRDVITGELAEPFQRWRQEQVTALVREVAVRSRSLRPEVQLSAAVFANWPESRHTVGQDWVAWVREGYLDFVCPMDYISDVDDFEAMVRRQVDWVDGRIPLYAGIGAWQMASVDDILTEVATSRRLGADGFVLFEYSADLAERVLPMLHAGLTRRQTHVAHGGPHVRFTIDGDTALNPDSGNTLYRAGQPLRVGAQLVSRAAVPRAAGRLVLERLESSEAVAGETGLATGAPARTLNFMATDSGDLRPVVHGHYRDATGKKRPFTRRGPILRVRTTDQIDSLALRFAPPSITGAGMAIGVYADGYGSGSIHEALTLMEGVVAFQARQLTDEILAATDVLVIPQPHNRWTFNRQDRARLRRWVRDGGGLLVTHDMVGMRGAVPIIPEVCARGSGFPPATHFRVVTEHPAVAGLPAGMQSHSYYDHITLEAGPAGEILAVGEGGEPVLIVGDFGAGRYAALGLIPGLAPNDEEVPLIGVEAQLVQSVVLWLSAQ